MRLSMEEKQALYDYACPNHCNTVTRLNWVTALTVDPERKHRMLALARNSAIPAFTAVCVRRWSVISRRSSICIW